jgi:hypothetical protein
LDIPFLALSPNPGGEIPGHQVHCRSKTEQRFDFPFSDGASSHHEADLFSQGDE